MSRINFFISSSKPGPALFPQPKSFLKSKKYFLFWIASLFSNIGTWMQQVAQPWVMLTISQSSFLVGLDSFAMNAPAWLLTLWGGEIADRLDRKKIILVCQSIQFLAVLIMVALLGFGLLKSWILIVISLVVGITDALSMPSFQTIIPSLVKPSEIPKAVSLNAIQFNLSRTLGPAIAGVIMVQFGALVCFEANALSYIPFFFSIFWIYPAKNRTNRLPEKNIKTSSIKNTIKDVSKQPDLKNQLIATFTTALFCSPLVTFLPVLITDVFSDDIKNFGLISTAFGLGGLIGAIAAYLIVSTVKDKSPNLFGLVLGLVVIAAALNHSLNVLIGLMVFAGILLTLANNTANSYLQLKASSEVRGKYSSLFQLAFRGGLSLGALTSGLLISGTGIKKALLFNGILAVIIQFILLMQTPIKNGHSQHKTQNNT